MFVSGFIDAFCSEMICSQEKELSMSGRNWGDAVVDGSTLVFNVAGKPAFRIPLTDVGQVCSNCLSRHLDQQTATFLIFIHSRQQ